MSYDGTTDLNIELANLYQCSPKDNNKMSALRGEAKQALNIVGKVKFNDAQRLEVYRWHYARINGSNNPILTIESNNPTEQVTNGTGSNNPISVATKTNDVNIPTAPKTISKKAISGDFKLINFSVRLSKGRTVISLESYIVDALKRRFTLADNTQVRQWIESVMTGNFDPAQPIMRQIRFAIIQALI
jgi:hypothetical protein